MKKFGLFSVLMFMVYIIPLSAHASDFPDGGLLFSGQTSSIHKLNQADDVVNSFLINIEK